MAFFTDKGKKNPKIPMEPQQTLNSQIYPEKKKNKAGGIIVPDFKNMS